MDDKTMFAPTSAGVSRSDRWNPSQNGIFCEQFPSLSGLLDVGLQLLCIVEDTELPGTHAGYSLRGINMTFSLHSKDLSSSYEVGAWKQKVARQQREAGGMQKGPGLTVEVRLPAQLHHG
ncbi:hypothetical protein CPLU01_10932 [Colletotrichum plurivorum]|uniref:Uncharacterized protein n=1 Tax=Colletotrichum plurivorum TaxID=2175906 RepID=A0A8H6K4N5_9PEZI|nr:hypothetical protein CPLU01_10932 [Colletotrichum plurivorum]